MLISKFMVIVFAIIYPFYSYGQVKDELNLQTGHTAMQISLQKELFEILVNDSNEVQAEYIKNNTFYKNDNLNQYIKLFSKICTNDPIEKCPEIFFTTRDLSGIASMYPNGVLAINEEIISKITLDEATFVFAHEYAHYKFQHSKQRVKVIAKSVVDNALPIKEPEQALASAGFMVKVEEAHHRYEDEADNYGFHYIKNNKIIINCERMFSKISGNVAINTDKHPSVENRCKNFNQNN